MFVLLPLLGMLQVCHWLGFLCDELFFRGYRRVVVREPVFVTGVPRSGTTLLHRTLSADEQYTTFSTWECLFAPSVTQRRVVQGVAWLDARVGSPLRRLLGVVERRVFAGLDDVHDMSLSDSEEDYFVFMPLFSCFILIVPFPYAAWLWDMGRFDSSLNQRERKRLMRYYHGCVKRHLYAHEPGKRFLSKNASFPPLINSLLAEFSDARVIICMRDPLQVVPSQLSSIRSGMALFDNDPYDELFRDRLVAQLGFYYRNLLAAPIPVSQSAWVVMGQLQQDVAGAVEGIYNRLGIDLSAAFAAALSRQAQAARRYDSGHTYSLDEFGLDDAQIREHFRDVYAHKTFQSLTQSMNSSVADGP